MSEGLTAVVFDVEPFVPYGADKARKLGLKVYDAPRPPASYGPAVVAALRKLTRKKVVLA